MEIRKRPRRLRISENIRNLVKEVLLEPDSLVYPVFVVEGEKIKEEIKSMPGQFRFSIDTLNEEIEEALTLGVTSFLFFGIPEEKDCCGTGGYSHNGIVQRAVRSVKERFGKRITVITDVCMCEYTSHGHCGILDGENVDNDKTLVYIAQTALSHAEAGADIVAPSDMMDGRIGVIREILDRNGFENVAILAYSVKYASAFYGPFREAAESAPSFGDRKSYQMDFRRRKEAVTEALLDIEEGADMIMVKPAMAYLDIISMLHSEVRVPIAAYNVSGEYSMVKAAAEKGWIDERKVVLEQMTALKRGGADIIITYFAKDIARWIR